MISIFDYQEYREYLRDYYLDQKTKKSGLTYSRFSSTAGIRSPNYLKVVIDGQKNLTPENIVRFAKALGLKEQESDYFEALVHFNQSKAPMQREFFEERLIRVRSRHQTHRSRERLLSEYEFEAISDWKHHAVMVLTNIRGFENRVAWIKERLFHLASEQEVSSILERLLAIKLIAPNEQGRVKQTHRQIKTKPELGRVMSRAFYEGLLARAGQALKLTEPEEREFCNYLVGLSPQQIPELKRKIRKFMNELNDWAMENSKPHQVYSLGFFGFPVTSIEKRHSQ